MLLYFYFCFEEYFGIACKLGTIVSRDKSWKMNLFNNSSYQLKKARIPYIVFHDMFYKMTLSECTIKHILVLGANSHHEQKDKANKKASSKYIIYTVTLHASKWISLRSHTVP